MRNMLLHARVLIAALFISAGLCAQGTAQIAVGAGPGSRNVDVDMSAVTGGTVTVTVEGQASVVLDSSSGTETFEVPVGKKITITSSNGKWKEITNNGSSLGVKGGGGGGSSDPAGPELEGVDG